MPNLYKCTVNHIGQSTCLRAAVAALLLGWSSPVCRAWQLEVVGWLACTAPGRCFKRSQGTEWVAWAI